MISLGVSGRFSFLSFFSFIEPITTADQAQLEFYLHWSGNISTTASGTYSVLANDDGTIKVTGIDTEIGNDRGY
ncbi:MAG: hypothetical protein RAO94_02065 [Candidatus Stygibacter australis]|nr:hypothetical protein [Candidatus Stygibacter australis]MDP8321116.1 hypothetical protein [Candidatus Stygibacter australis]